MEALSQLNYLPENKEQITTFVEAARNEFLSGEIDVFEVLRKIKIIQTTFDKIIKDEKIKGVIFDELNKSNDKYIDSECEIKHTSRRNYDYSNDEIWVRLNSDKKSKDNKLKEREKYLKGLSQANNGIDLSTGEILEPPVLTYTDILTIKIK